MQQASTVKLPQIFENFKETMRGLKINKTIISARYAFIVNNFALGCKEQHRNDKKTHVFSNSPGC